MMVTSKAGLVSNLFVKAPLKTKSPIKNSFQESMQRFSKNHATSKLSIENSLEKVINNHEKATKMVEKSMLRSHYSAQSLLKIQYKTGIFFLSEQMFCKTAELSANTLKSFTQMQV